MKRGGGGRQEGVRRGGAAGGTTAAAPLDCPRQKGSNKKGGGQAAAAAWGAPPPPSPLPSLLLQPAVGVRRAAVLGCVRALMKETSLVGGAAAGARRSPAAGIMALCVESLARWWSLSLLK